MDQSNIKARIRSFFASLPAGRDISSLSDDDSFANNELLASITSIQLILFLEREFSVQVEARDLTGENFDSIEGLTRYILAKGQRTT